MTTHMVKTLKGRRQAKKNMTTVPNIRTICLLPLVTAAGSVPGITLPPTQWAEWVEPACFVTLALIVRFLAMTAYSMTSTARGSQKKREMIERK